MPHEEIGFACSKCKLPQTLSLTLSGEGWALLKGGLLQIIDPTLAGAGTAVVQKPLKTVIHPCSHYSLGTRG
jgi:hypothetical protein